MSIREIFPIDKWDFKSQSVLTGLPEDELQVLTAHQTENIYSKGEIIFREGGYPSGIFYIKKGKAKKYKVAREGGEQIIYVANAGELLGFHAVLEGDRYPDSAAALEESLIAFIPKEDFLKVLEQSSELSKRLLKTLSHEFAVVVNSLALFSQHSVRERLALQLVVLREKYKIDFTPGMPVEINLSREDLANLVGTARENIVRTLSEFKAEGIVETRGRKIIVKDVVALIKIADYK
ncbi:MAG: Crp/Fnr family transcriptional regulator [Pseudobacter sp.]|uniref:Crp/Fnr family transcriptional regulator n=1 Tax=Pseudobacter sp. TaxID=2045420 RepID=UPI003F7E7634